MKKVLFPTQTMLSHVDEVLVVSLVVSPDSISSPCSEMEGSTFISGLQEIIVPACTQNPWGRTSHSLLTYLSLSIHMQGKSPREVGQPRWEAAVVVSLELYLCELHSGRVSKDGAIWHLVASVADQLAVPHTEIVLPVRPLREHRDGRSAQDKAHPYTTAAHQTHPHCSHRNWYQHKMFYILKINISRNKITHLLYPPPRIFKLSLLPTNCKRFCNISHESYKISRWLMEYERNM